MYFRKKMAERWVGGKKKLSSPERDFIISNTSNF
jgi:hypothetical protein